MIRTLLACIVGFFFFTTAANAQTCGIYPNNLMNAMPADATQVMANFNSILTCANTTLAPLASPNFTGNVSIGNTSPLGELSVGTGNSSITINASDVSTGAWLRNDGLNTVLSTNIGSLFLGYGGITSEMIHIGNKDPGVVVITGNAPAYSLFLGTNGYVGIGSNAPTYPLYVNGTAYATGAAGALSDRRHKTDIEALDVNALEIIAQLKPVTFYWKEPRDDGMKGRQIGFIAQDVQTVLPDVVLIAKNAEKTLGLKYDSLIPVLTRAIQQQQAQIKSLKSANDNQAAQVAKQANEIAELQAQMRKLQRTARAGMPEADTHLRRTAFVTGAR